MITFTPENIPEASIGSYSWSGINIQEDPSSNDYLQFARQDLADGQQPRHRINGLSNVKRALHLRLQDLCQGFGALNMRKFKGFPDYIAYIRKCGVVAPGILDRLNKVRNSVEHDYEIPSLEEVETFADTTELFISATDRWIDRHPCSVDFDGQVLDASEQYALYELIFHWESSAGTLKIRPVKSRQFADTLSVTFSAAENEAMFFRWTQFILSNNY